MMKFYTYLLCLLCILFFACKKSNEKDDSNETLDRCALIRIDGKDPNTGTVSYSCTLQYDSNKRVSVMLINGTIAKSGQDIVRFMYQGNTVVAKREDTLGRIREIDTIVTDGQQNILHIGWVQEPYHGGLTFSYNSNGQLYKTRSQSDNSYTDTYYEWLNGDVIKDSISPNAQNPLPFITEYEYYTDKAAQHPIYFREQFYAFLRWGKPWYKNLHLLKSQKDKYAYFRYAHDFDAAGKIIRSVETNEFGSGNIEYGYQCQ